MNISSQLLEAEVGTVLPPRETMARFTFLNAFVYAPSAAVIVLNNTNNSSATALAGASITIIQTAG